MPDDSAPAVHGAVAAVLAVMPTNGSGEVITRGPNGYGWQTGSPKPLAAKYAAAVLRWAVENADEGVHVTVSNWMRAQADEIDPPMGAAR